jgi:hypothetical protein
MAAQFVLLNGAISVEQHSQMMKCSGDDSFGPGLSQDEGCDRFDFTLLFEEAVFVIVPCALALFLIPWRLWYLLWRKSKVLNWPSLLAAKWVCVLSWVF